jgi:PKD repeat protein
LSLPGAGILFVSRGRKTNFFGWILGAGARFGVVLLASILFIGAGAASSPGVRAAPTPALTLTPVADPVRLVTNPALVISSPPQALPAYQATFADAAFGTPVTRVTGDTGAAFPLGTGGTGNWGADARHHYSKDEPWNPGGSLLMLQNSGLPEDLLLDGLTYAVLAGRCPNYPSGDDRWHPSPAHPRERINVTDTELMWFDVVSCVKTRSWTLPFPVHEMGWAEGNPSADGRFVALADSSRVFVVDMDPQPPFAAYPASRIGPAFDFSNCGLPDCQVGWVSVSASGRYVVVKYSQDHPRVLDVDPNTLVLTPHVYPPTITACAGDPGQGFIYDLGHADLALDPFAGNQDVLIGQEHCGLDGATLDGQLMGKVAMVRLGDGAVTSLTDPVNEASPHHVSARNADRPGWAYVSYEPEPGRRFSDEIVAVKLDGSKAVERLVHEHSDFDQCYRCESHAVPSPDGRRVLWASNWTLDCNPCGSTTDIKAYVVDLTTAADAATGYTETFVADASATSDEAGQVVSYTFDFGDGTRVGPQSASRTTHSYHAGQWLARVTAVDDQGASDSASVQVSVVAPPNTCPDGMIDSPAGPVAIEAGGSVVFAATGQDAEDDLPLGFSWDFGGGAPDQTVEAPGSVTFAAPGTYLVTLTVTDSRGASDPTPATVLVTVVAPVTGPNLVGNPSFETGTGGWNASGSATLTRVSGGYDGAYSIEFQATGSGSFGLNDSPSWVASTPAAGTHYRLTAWVRSVASHGQAKIKLREYHNGTQVGSTLYSPQKTLAPAWQQLTLDYLAQSAGDNLDFQVLDEPAVAGEALQVDLVSVVIVSSGSGTVGVVGSGADAGVAAAPLVGTIAPQPISRLGTLRFRTTRAGALRVQLFDTRGRRARLLLDDPFAVAGVHEIAIPVEQASRSLAPGVYFYRIEAAEGSSTGRVLVLK